MKRPRNNENPGPSHVSRRTGPSNHNRGKVREMSSEPPSPATSKSSSTSCSTSADTRGEEGDMSSESSSPATSTSVSSVSAGAEDAKAERWLRKNEPRAYIQLAKYTLKDDKDKYRDFVELLKGDEQRRIDLPGVITRVAELFKDHPQLVLGWFKFLRVRSEKEALAYLQLVKEKFKYDKDKYRDFKQIFTKFKESKLDIDGVTTRVKELFEDHRELLVSWFAFLRLTKDEAVAYVELVGDKLVKDDQTKLLEFVALLKKYKKRKIGIRGLVARVKELFKGHPQLVLGFNTCLSLIHSAPRR